MWRTELTKARACYYRLFLLPYLLKKLLILKMIYDIVLVSYNSDCQLTILHGHHAHSKHEALRFVSQFISPGLKRKERKEETEKIIIFCNYSEPCKFTFCECLHSNRIVNLYGEVTTWAKEKLRSSDFANGVLNSYHKFAEEKENICEERKL